MTPQLKRGAWKLSDLLDVPKNRRKVFSCFHCGGGSTMGYKLAGYDVLGGVEIDPEMMKIYRTNHNPTHSYLMGVQEFNKIPNDKLPKELFNLDILDGSPPCSSFSMAGSREKKWGEAHKFREGQSVQVLDDLFFHFIDTARKLQPKIVIAENVKGLIIGKAKGYVKQIVQMFNHAGYDVQLFLLNAAFMGVPQKRERTFFVARKKDNPSFKLNFDETPVTPSWVFSDLEKETGPSLTPLMLKRWTQSSQGTGMGKVGAYNAQKKIAHNEPAFTQTSSLRHWHWSQPRALSDKEVLRLQSFPDDYSFQGLDAQYICGMSVPPFMMQRVSQSIGRQMGWYQT